MRLNFEFTEEQLRDLKALQVKTGSSTMKEMFNSAMSMLEWAVEETRNGNEIVAINEQSDQYRVLVMPILKKAAKQRQESEKLDAAAIEEHVLAIA